MTESARPDETVVVWTHPAMVAALVAISIVLAALVLLLPAGRANALPAGVRLAIGVTAAIVPLGIGAVFLRLRVRLGAEALRFSFGPFGHNVPYASIRLVEPTTYRWRQFGGWGIRWGAGGERAYNVMGDRGLAVRLRFERDGREYAYLLSARDPSRLAGMIRRRLPSARPV